MRYPPLNEQLDTAPPLEFEGIASCPDTAAGAPQSPPTMPKAWAPSAPSDRALWVRQTPAKSTSADPGQGCGLELMSQQRGEGADNGSDVPSAHQPPVRSTPLPPAAHITAISTHLPRAICRMLALRHLSPLLSLKADCCG